MRPSAVQCLQHPYFQVGIRAPLSVRSPVSNASSHTTPSSKALGGSAAMPPQLSQQRRLSRDVSFGQKPSLPSVLQPAAAPARGMGAAAGRESFGTRDAGMLPSLNSFGSIGPRNARYKPGVKPLAAAAGSNSGDAAASQRDSASSKPSAGSLLPTVKKAPLGLTHGIPAAKGPGGLEARYGLGRRY
jgi:hypothetical protein